MSNISDRSVSNSPAQYNAADLRYVPGIPISIGNESAPADHVCPSGSKTHTIVKGDTLSKLAADYQTTVASILVLNPGLRAATKLTIGRTLCIPPPIPCTGTRYVLRSGDTLYAIARSNGLTLEQLLKANPTINPKFYRAGDTICIPAVPSAPAPCPCEVSTYTVKPGDTLCSIAQAVNMPLYALQLANPAVDFMDLKPGTVLNILPLPQLPHCRAENQYVIGAGETLADIAQRFNVSMDELLTANPCYAPEQFTSGNIICIPVNGSIN